MTATLLRTINPECVPSVSVILQIGEALSSLVVDKWADDRADVCVMNDYGLTETSVIVTWAKRSPSIHMFQLLADVQAYILDQHMRGLVTARRLQYVLYVALYAVLLSL